MLCLRGDGTTDLLWGLVCCAWQQAFLSDPLDPGLFGILGYSEGRDQIMFQLYGMNALMLLASHCMTSYFAILTMWAHMGNKAEARVILLVWSEQVWVWVFTGADLCFYFRVMKPGLGRW